MNPEGRSRDLFATCVRRGACGMKPAALRTGCLCAWLLVTSGILLGGEGPKSLDALIGRARKGDADAQLTLAQKYRLGDSVARDYMESMRWSRAAADQGNASGLDLVGCHYYTALGVPENFDVAV